jgi:hypothetical protein
MSDNIFFEEIKNHRESGVYGVYASYQSWSGCFLQLHPSFSHSNSSAGVQLLAGADSSFIRMLREGRFECANLRLHSCPYFYF